MAKVVVDEQSQGKAGRRARRKGEGPRSETRKAEQVLDNLAGRCR